MKLQLIRNATMKIKYTGFTLLTDPVLGNKHTIESFGGKSKNPTVELPVPAEEVVTGLDAILASHLHQDHFDQTAEKLLSKTLPLICQPQDQQRLMDKGFQNIMPIDKNMSWNSIEITRTPGSHGQGKWAEDLAPVSGFVLQAKDEPVVYWIGDSVLTRDVEEVIHIFQPDIILTHSSGAILGDSGPIVMDAEQTVSVCKLAPKAKVVAVHMEALDHGTVTRDDLYKHALSVLGSPGNLIIPDDGEILSFNIDGFVKSPTSALCCILQ